MDNVEYYDYRYREDLKKKIYNEAKEERWKKNKDIPWSFYNDLKTSAIPTPEVVIEKVKTIAKFNIRLAAAISLIYLTGSRIAEITKYRYDGVYSAVKSNNELYKPSIRCNDLWIEEDERNNSWLVIKTRVEKRKEKREIYKHAHILYSEENYLWPFIKIVEDYLDTTFTEEQKEANVPLFLFSSDYVRDELKRFTGYSPHILRVYRAKHLVRYDKFDVPSLKLFFGWASADLAVQYAASDVVDMRRKILGLA